MTSDILHSLMSELKLLNSEQKENDDDITNCGQGYSSEIRKWTVWINSQNIETLPRRRPKVKDLIESIPPATDWRQITGFDTANTSAEQQPNRPIQPSKVLASGEIRHISGDRRDVSNDDVANDGSLRQETAGVFNTSSPQTVSVSTVSEPPVACESTAEGTEDQTCTLKQLIEEQKELQSALRKDMKSQEKQFREQYLKLAEQQRRLTERDAMRELVQQQQNQQQILMQQMVAASQPPPGMASSGLFPSHLSNPATFQSLSPGASFSLPSANLPPQPMTAAAPPFQTTATVQTMLVPPQYQSVSLAPPINQPMIPSFPFSGMSFPNSGPEYLRGHQHEDLSTSSQWNTSDVQTRHNKFTELNSEATNDSSRALKERSSLGGSENTATKMNSSPSKQPPLSVMQKLLAAQLLSDPSDDEQFGAGVSNVTLMDKADNLMTSSANYAGASWMSSDSGTITGVTLGVTSRGEWTATLNNPGNAWRWEVIVAVMKGWLVRRLMRTEKVLVLITTIRDARDFLANLRYAEEEFPGMTDAKDAQLQQRVISQLRAAIFDLHHVFFELPMRAKLDLIVASRKHLLNKRLHGTNMSAHSSRGDMNISSATLKARERKQKGAPRASADCTSTPREKKTPKRVDCGLRGGYLPKRDPPQPVKLDPRKYYSKHALFRPRSAGGMSARSSSRDSSVTSSFASSVSRAGDTQQHHASSATTSTETPNNATSKNSNNNGSRGRHEKQRKADMYQK